MLRPAYGIAAVACLFTTLSLSAAAPSDIRVKPFTFTATDIPNSGFGEPFIVVTPDYHVIICGPTGGEEGVVRTTDWVNFTRTNVNSAGGSGGGDCDLAVGPDKTVYISDLQLAATSVSKSIDDGASFDYQQAEEPIEQDRQWLAVDPKDGSIVYLAYHDLTLEAEIVAKSTDGGRHFVEHSLVSRDPAKFGDTFPNTFSGPIRIDPTDHNRLYVVYAISSVGTNLGACTGDSPENCPFGSPEQIMVATSTDGGRNWVNKVAMSAPPGSVLGNLFPSIALDSGGNIYVAAAGHIPVDGNQVNGLFYAVSTDHGMTWSAPIKVNTTSGATIFPAIVAGTPGRVDFAWVESDRPDHRDGTGTWNVYFAQTRNGRHATPTIRTFAGPEVHKGEVCVSGLVCVTSAGDRSLADFMTITLDPFGYAHMAVASNATSPTHVLYWRQESGGSLYSPPCEVPGPRCVYKRPKPKTKP